MVFGYAQPSLTAPLWGMKQIVSIEATQQKHVAGAL
jgi:hypothetical protein